MLYPLTKDFSDGVEEGVRISGNKGLKGEVLTVTWINSMVMVELKGGWETARARCVRKGKRRN